MLYIYTSTVTLVYSILDGVDYVIHNTTYFDRYNYVLQFATYKYTSTRHR